MELTEFIENFLPDYNNLLVNFDKKDYLLFLQFYFREAFENYTEIICKKQLEILSKNFDYDNLRCIYIDVKNFKERPKIEEL